MGVNCKPIGGICNRLKFIISCIDKYGDIKLEWAITTDGGVGCNFNDIYKNKFSDINYGNNTSGCEFIDKSMNTNNNNHRKLNIDENTRKRYIDIFNSLELVDEIKEKIETDLSKLPSKFTLVSIRSFTSFARENKSWGNRFDINKAYNYISKIEDDNIVLMGDNVTINKQIRDKFPHVILFRENQITGEFNNKTGVSNILRDLYIGLNAETIYGTNMSSFPELQWLLSGLPASKYINMILHNY